MKKYNELIEKVEFFEKLAIYSDRKEFFNSIAQSSVTYVRKLLPNEVKALNILSNHLNELGKDWTNSNALDLSRKLKEAANYNTLNTDQIIELVHQAYSVITKLEYPRGKKYNDAFKVENYFIKLKNKTLAPPADPLKTPAAISPDQYKIEPILQKLLNDLGYTPPLVADGILGEKTQKALNWYKTRVNSPNISNQDAIKKLLHMQTAMENEYEEKRKQFANK